jgi:hypothetical protein
MALPAVAVLTLVIIALTGGIVTLGLSQHGERQQDVHRLKALNAADAGLARVVEDIWDRYRAASPEQRVDLVDALDGKYCIEDRIDLMDEPFGQAFFDASVVEVVRDGDDHADVRIQTVGRSGDVVRKFTASPSAPRPRSRASRGSAGRAGSSPSTGPGPRSRSTRKVASSRT